jgi:hypothetical protein
MRLTISLIRTDGGTQPRAEINHAVVSDYADAMTDGAAFPPVVVFYDGERYWLADGFHRVKAAVQIGLLEIDADVRQGTRRDAVLYSVGANATHGYRRTNADKRRAVETLLSDEEWGKWSNYQIAEKCGVSEQLVRSLRLNRSDEPRTYTTKHGTEATMNTANIGRREVTLPSPEPPVPTSTASAARVKVPAVIPIPKEPVRVPAPATENDPMGREFIQWLNRVQGRALEISTTGCSKEEAFALALTESFREGRIYLR